MEGAGAVRVKASQSGGAGRPEIAASRLTAFRSGLSGFAFPEL